MHVYCAGPMRGRKDFNFPAFEATTKHLRVMGHEVFNPAERDLTAGFKTVGMTGNEDLSEEGFDLRAALAADLEYITLTADAICVLPGWEHSAGARAEVATAHALGLKVGPIHAFRLAGNEMEFNEGEAIKSDLQPSGTLATVTALKHSLEKREAERNGSKARHPAGKGKPPEAVSISKPFVGDSDLDRLGAVPNEVRSVSRTGGEKGVKLERFDLIPPDALEQVARHYGVGAAKYEANQYRRGYEYSKSYGAMQRHLNQWWNGEDNDEETGSSHLAAAAWHCLTLMTFMKEHPDFDDRIKN